MEASSSWAGDFLSGVAGEEEELEIAPEDVAAGADAAAEAIDGSIWGDLIGSGLGFASDLLTQESRMAIAEDQARAAEAQAQAAAAAAAARPSTLSDVVSENPGTTALLLFGLGAVGVTIGYQAIRSR